MRRIVALFALSIMWSCAGGALSQDEPTTTPKRVETDSSLSRQKTVFKKWATAMRESTESAKTMTNKKTSDRDAWLTKSLKTKEDKLRARYGLNPRQLFLINKRGLVEKWSTEKPEDFAAIESNVSAAVFEDDLKDWTIAHMPQGGDAREIAASGYYSEVQKRAPISICGAKLSDGKRCPRKVVGQAGQLCYEHLQ